MLPACFCCLLIWSRAWIVASADTKQEKEPPGLLSQVNHSGPVSSFSSCNFFEEHIRMGNFSALPAAPTIVTLNVYFEKLYSINTNSDLHLVMYVESRWYDPRIPLFVSQSKDAVGDRRCLLPFDKLTRRMWYPGLNFHVSGDVKVERLPRENVFVALNTDGNVYSRSKYEMYTPCWVNLRTFPMDKAFCRITITSLECDPSLVSLRWSKNRRFQTLLNTDTAEHHLLSISGNQSSEVEVGIAIDHLTIDLTFSRHVGWYLMHAYFPAYLIILISWLYTTLGTETRASRLQLRASLLLALVLMIYHILRQIPKVNYVKAIDVFMFMVLGFLTLSCVEDTIVTWCCNRAQKDETQYRKITAARLDRRNSLTHPHQANGRRKPARVLFPENITTTYDDWNVGPEDSPNGEARPLAAHDGCATSPLPSPKTPTNVTAATIRSCLDNSYRYRRLAERIDHVFIFLYPCLFVAANVIYWLYYGGFFEIVQVRYIGKIIGTTMGYIGYFGAT